MQKNEQAQTPVVDIDNDAELQIATASRRDASKWRNQTIMLSEFLGKLQEPQRTAETVEQFHRMAKGEQDQIKDVGGFVGGMLKGGSRAKSAVANRSLLTLDGDFAGKDFIEKARQQLSDCAWFIYSTHKHAGQRPRYRLVVPLSAPCSVEQYEPAMRAIAEKVGIDRFDDTTYDINRMMYWPSTSSDGDYVFEHNDAPLADVDDVLRYYGDEDQWKDTALWPTSSRESGNFDRRLKRQQKPTEKKGVVGAWCRCVSIYDAIENYLGDVYTRESDNRYTYVDGTTSKGLVIYEDQFAYSNHGTDPAQGELCNAFDLVRMHRYGHLDDGAKDNTPTHKLPSYKAMADFASERKDVKADLVRSQMGDVGEMFDDMVGNSESGDESPEDWEAELQADDNGQAKPTFYNILKILENDPGVNQRAHYNELSARVERGRTGEMWGATDSYHVREYVGQRYTTDFPETKVEQAIENRAHQLTFHPIREYLESLQWDGVPRVDSLFVDWLGAADNEYVREAARCWLIAAVKRVYEPGYKFDHVPVLGGRQGIGKTSFIEIMARRNWYSELSSFDPKVAMEETQGAWLIELNELGASNKSELEQQKAFISARSTRVRMAYARHAVEHKRQFVLIGTTNENEYLKDSTGNRRWWPIDCGSEEINLDTLRENVDQIWAEAHDRAMILGEDPHMSSGALEIAGEAQSEKVEGDDWQGMIGEWLQTQARSDRYERDFDEDVDKVIGAEYETRTRVCVPEIAEDCLSIPASKLDRRTRLRIARIMDTMDNWEKGKSIRFGKRFGRQKGWMICEPF